MTTWVFTDGHTEQHDRNNIIVSHTGQPAFTTATVAGIAKLPVETVNRMAGDGLICEQPRWAKPGPGRTRAFLPCDVFAVLVVGRVEQLGWFGASPVTKARIGAAARAAWLHLSEDSLEWLTVTGSNHAVVTSQPNPQAEPSGQFGCRIGDLAGLLRAILEAFAAQKAA